MIICDCCGTRNQIPYKCMLLGTELHPTKNCQRVSKLDSKNGSTPKVPQNNVNPTHKLPIIISSLHKQREKLISIVLITTQKKIRNIYMMSYIISMWHISFGRVPWQVSLYAYPVLPMDMLMFIQHCGVNPSHPKSIYYQEEMPIRFLSLILYWMIIF